MGAETGMAQKERHSDGAVSPSLGLGDVETQLRSQVRQKGLTVLDEESHAATTRGGQAGVRSQKAPQLLGLQEAPIAAQVPGELSWVRGLLIGWIKFT